MRLHGHDALAYAEAHRLTLHLSTLGLTRHGVPLEEATAIAAQTPHLIYVDTHCGYCRKEEWTADQHCVWCDTPMGVTMDELMRLSVDERRALRQR